MVPGRALIKRAGVRLRFGEASEESLGGTIACFLVT
jgi:hypothetical protein